VILWSAANESACQILLETAAVRLSLLPARRIFAEVTVCRSGRQKGARICPSDAEVHSPVELSVPLRWTSSNRELGMFQNLRMLHLSISSVTG